MINTDAGRQAFDEKGVIVVPVTKEMEPVNMDKYLEVAIEVGAEDVILSEEDNGDKDEKNIVLKVNNSLTLSTLAEIFSRHHFEIFFFFFLFFSGNRI